MSIQILPVRPPPLPLGPHLLETPLACDQVSFDVLMALSLPCTDTLYKPEVCIGCVFLLLLLFKI